MTDFKFIEESFENVETCFQYLDKKKTNELDYYFDSYSYIGIHQEMLQDKIRTKAY